MENIKLDMNDKKKTLEMIYERTYAKAYVIAKQFVKNEEDALDVLQEAYISVFSHMESLQDESKLDKWVNMIVANRCKDWLRKKQVVLFSDMGQEAEDDYEATIEEDKLEFLPEESVDYAETKRLMAEILEALPEDQKMCILMYYYDELSVNEIAEGLGCSTGTVKSRLNYARKKIKEEVELLEKKGTKLYGIAPLPFIVWMLKGTEASAADSLNTPGVLQKVVGASASGKSVIVNSIPATRNITRKMVLGILKTKKAIAIISSLVVLGAGTTTYLALRNGSNGDQHNAQQETMSKTDEETIKEDDGLKDTAVSEEIKETENTDVSDALEDNETSTDTTTNTETSTKTETTNQPTTETKPQAQPEQSITKREAGLYDDNKTLLKSWDVLISENIISVNNGVVSCITGAASKLAGNLVMDENIKEIGFCGFSECTNLTSVEIPNSVIAINQEAFYGCTKLTSVTLSNALTDIGDCAFQECNNLVSITIPSSVKKIGGYAFGQCTKLTSLSVPSSVKTIGNGAFTGCSNLISIVLPVNNDFTHISEYLFDGCIALTTITIPSSVKSIGMEAFYGCINLATINYKGSETDWNSITIEYGAIPSNTTINYNR